MKTDNVSFYMYLFILLCYNYLGEVYEKDIFLYNPFFFITS